MSGEQNVSTSSTLEKLLVLYGHHFPVRRGKLRVIDSFWRAAVRDRSTRRIAALKHGGLKMPCDVSEMLQRQFYFFGTYLLAEDLLRCWEQEASHAAVIFDVGANAGIFSLAALAARPDAIVHAFEPTGEIAAGLRETARLNGLTGLHVHDVAVDRTCGEVALKRCRGEIGTNEGMNFIKTADGAAGEELVAAVSLDRFCENHSIDRIDLLKLDIQGNEHRALAGARRMLRAGRIRTIFTELNWADNNAATCPATESIRVLERAGYQFARPGKRLHWRPSGTWLRTLTDVVACRAGSRYSSQQ